MASWKRTEGAGPYRRQEARIYFSYFLHLAIPLLKQEDNVTHSLKTIHCYKFSGIPTMDTENLDLGPVFHN